jgi:hypothetical protein
VSILHNVKKVTPIGEESHAYNFDLESRWHHLCTTLLLGNDTPKPTTNHLVFWLPKLEVRLRWPIPFDSRIKVFRERVRSRKKGVDRILKLGTQLTLTNIESVSLGCMPLRRAANIPP